MINEGLLKDYNIGKDGFIWWLGQVCDSKTWKDNYPCLPVESTDDLPGFKRRVKVSILGWHTSNSQELKTDELPWAYCLLPVTAGGGTGGAGEDMNLTGGEWVFGFFLDGEDGQQPVIIGVLDKSTQNNWRDSVPDAKYVPFSGFSNKRVAPLQNIKKDKTVKKQPVGSATTKVGDTGVQRTQTEPTETVRLEGDNVRPKGSQTRYDNAVATSDMTACDNSDDDNPFGATEKVMKRLSRIETFVKKHNGIQVDGSQNKLFDEAMKREQKRSQRIIAGDQKTQANKMRAATLEAASKMMSNNATFGKLADMAKVKNKNVDAIGNIVGQFTSMIDKMPASAGDFVKQSANKIVSQPPCVTESYVGALMGQNVAQLDGMMNNMMGPVNAALSAASGGSFPPNLNDTIGGLLTGGLNAFGGMSIDLDGIATFATSYTKMLKGDKPIPSTPVRDMNMLDGGLPEAPSEVKGGNILEDLAAKIPTSDQLTKGGTNFLKNNSIFSTAINSDNMRLESLGGIGGIKDTLGKAANLAAYSAFPAGTGPSVINIAKSFLEQGDTLDAAALAAERVFPGGRDFIKQAFNTQLGGQRLAGGGCETGPTQNGPPLIKIFGGNGNGATANAVIGATGNILAIELTRPGKGFTEPPFAVVSDSSGNGRGGIVKVNLDYDNPDKSDDPWTYNIKDIDVIEPGYGYMGKPDGSIGGNCRQFAEANATMIKDKEGNYYQFEPGTGIKVPPGGVVYLPAGVTCQLPISAIKTNGEPLAPLKGSNIIDYAAIRLMHNFDVSAGKIIPGPQGAEGRNKPGFGRGIDYPAAKEAGFSDSDIRFFLEGDPARGQKTAGVSGYFVRHMNGAIGRNMQKLLDDPSWGPLPIMNSAGKLPGRIKSVQINLKKGYKGFAKVTDGSRLGAGPILRLRDAVTDRKISNVLEVQTGNAFNINPEVGGNTEILSLFKEQELRAINGTPIEQHGRFGTAGKQTWEQTKLGAGGSRVSLNKGDKNYKGEHTWVRKWYKENLCREPDPGGLKHWTDLLNSGKTRAEVDALMKVATPEYANVQADRAAGKISPEKCKWEAAILGGGQRMNILGEKYRTLDPWRADLADGTRLTFRGVYNHNTGMSQAQLAKPYDLSLNNYRYFVFDYEVEVYSTPKGYDYTRGIDTQKDKWYRLIDIKYVTGTEDWFDGEVVKKRCLDKAGRLYEMYITICTYSDETTQAIGTGLATNTEVQEIIKTPLPCESPKLTGGKYCDFQKVRWTREMNGKTTVGEQWGHIPGSERSNLIREIVKVYNEVGDDDKKRFTDYHNAEPYKDARKYVDKKGLEAQVAGYLRQLGRFRKGESCEKEQYEVKKTTAGKQEPVTFHVTTAAGFANRVQIGELGIDIGKPRGDDQVNQKTQKTVKVGQVYSVKFISTGNIRLRNAGDNTIEMEEHTDNDWKDLVINATKGRFFDLDGDTAKFTIPAKDLGTEIKSRYIKVTPLTEDEYQKYKNDFNEIEPRAFACLKKNIWKGFIQAAKTAGPIVLEQTYCDWARQYVEEVRTTWRPAKTIGYELPCGGEITAPREDPTPPVVSSDPKILTPKQVKINNTGMGYTDKDKILIDGDPTEFEIDPNGRIISVTPPTVPMFDYPEIDIITDTGAGADIEVLLKVEEPPDDPTLRPLEMVEVIDCVGKNIFIKES